MAEITFLGLGLMGAALAETMVNAGHDTVVWNRTASKVDPLTTIGATQASSPAEAISESPITVVCVGDYDASDSFLRTPESLAALNGRVLVQLTSGSYRLARTANEWASEAGAAICEATGISIKQYIELARPIIGADIEAQYESVIKYEDGNLDETEAYLKQWTEVLDPIIDTSENAGLNSEFPKFARSMLNRAIEQGWGEQDVGALIKILRSGNS